MSIGLLLISESIKGFTALELSHRHGCLDDKLQVVEEGEGWRCFAVLGGLLVVLVSYLADIHVRLGITGGWCSRCHGCKR